MAVTVEHIAVNVADPVAMASWYCEHLGMQVVRQGDPPASMHFLADASGRVILEIYNALPDDVPDYGSMKPLVLHIAFASQDAEADFERLVAAGALAVSDGVGVNADGDHMAMLRDPWGMTVQLCQRVVPMP
jgi:glyoxylase I family protein